MNENPLAALPPMAITQADLARLEAELAATEAREALAQATVAKAEAVAALARVKAAYQPPAPTHELSPELIAPPVVGEHASIAHGDDAPDASIASPAPPPVVAPPPAIQAASVPSIILPPVILPPLAIPGYAIPPTVVPTTAIHLPPPALTAPPLPIAALEEQPQSVSWFFDNRFVQCTSAVLFSAIVHLLLLIVLGLWLFPDMVRQSQGDLLASQDLTSQELVTQTLDTKITPTNELSLTGGSLANPLSVGDTGMTGVGEPTYKKVASKAPQTMSVKIGDVERISSRGKTLTKDVPAGTKGDPLVVVDDYQQAMDRITQEILLRLTKGKVLVVWCFDQSESMKDDRDEIRQRIDRVYTELGLSGAAKDDALLTSIVSYGQGMSTHTRHATANIELIRTAMDQVPTDPSGFEMQCQAVGHAIADHRGHVNVGHRQMMLILVTDESGHPGENVQVLEATIAEAKAAGCAIYVLGREAVFGYPYAHMNATVTVPAVGGGTISRSFVVPIDRGPETPFVEQLQTEGFRKRMDAHPSGFGPFEQVRMARETGGMFFMLPSPEIALFQRDDRKYELERLRPYMPDLSSREDYANERDKHPDRATLWKVINDLNPYDPERAKYITPAMSFSADPATFVKEVRFEQERAKQYIIYLDAAERALEGMKKERQREPLPRWQANYDLIFAQLLAYKVRMFEYGAYLEAFINKPKQIDPATPYHQLHHWVVVHRHETITGYVTESYLKRSQALFEAVLREHEGTPWAARADFELQRGFGVELNPVYYNPNPPPSFGPPMVPQQPIVAPNL